MSTRHKSRKRLKYLVLPLLFFGSSCLMARNFQISEQKTLLAGYGYGMNLEGMDEYSYYFIGLNFNYPSKDTGWTKNISLQLEPFISVVESPQLNMELGASFLIKYTIDWRFPVKPYIRGGSGVIYISQETEEQSTNFNFVSQAGYGLSYQKGEASLLVEYRNRHISNAGIRYPNSGIDTYLLLIGISGQF